MNRTKQLILATTLPFIVTSAYAGGNKPAQAPQDTLKVGQAYIHQGDIGKLTIDVDEGSNSTVAIYGGDSLYFHSSDVDELEQRVEDLGKKIKELEKPKPCTKPKAVKKSTVPRGPTSREVQERLDQHIDNSGYIHGHLRGEIRKTQSVVDSLTGIVGDFYDVLQIHEDRLDTNDVKQDALGTRVDNIEGILGDITPYVALNVGYGDHFLVGPAAGVHVRNISVGMGINLHGTNTDSKSHTQVIGTNLYGHAEEFVDLEQKTSEHTIYVETAANAWRAVAGVRAGVSRSQVYSEGERGVRHVRNDGTVTEEDIDPVSETRKGRGFAYGAFVGANVYDGLEVIANLDHSREKTALGLGVRYHFGGK